MNSPASIDIFRLCRITINIFFPSQHCDWCGSTHKQGEPVSTIPMMETSTRTFSLMAKLLTRKISWQWKRSLCSAVLVFTTPKLTRAPASWWPNRGWLWTVSLTTPRPRTMTPPGWRGNPFLRLRSSISTGFSQYLLNFFIWWKYRFLVINSMTRSTTTARLSRLSSECSLISTSSINFIFRTK